MAEGQTGHRLFLCSARAAEEVSKVIAPNLHSHLPGLRMLHILGNARHFVFILAVLVGRLWYLLMVLVCMFLITKEIVYFSLCLLVIWMFFFVKCLEICSFFCWVVINVKPIFTFAIVTFFILLHFSTVVSFILLISFLFQLPICICLALNQTSICYPRSDLSSCFKEPGFF